MTKKKPEKRNPEARTFSTIPVRVNREERKSIEARAETMSYPTVSEYMRAAALGTLRFQNRKAPK